MRHAVQGVVVDLPVAGETALAQRMSKSLIQQTRVTMMAQEGYPVVPAQTGGQVLRIVLQCHPAQHRIDLVDEVQFRAFLVTLGQRTGAAELCHTLVQFAQREVADAFLLPGGEIPPVEHECDDKKQNKQRPPAWRGWPEPYRL